MCKDKYILWRNINLDFDDWKDDLKEYYPDLSEDSLIQKMYELNADYLDDARVNLNVQLSQPIIVIGELGLWNGKATGYKMIESGNIKDCLNTECDLSEWYIDKFGDLRCTAIHHDGRNNYLYRVLKDNLSSTQIENFLFKIYTGKATRQDITRYTKRLGDEITRAYGFELPNQRAVPAQVR